MYVKRTTRGWGEKEYTYLSLVESVRVNGKKTHETLLRLGEIGELECSGPATLWPNLVSASAPTQPPHASSPPTGAASSVRKTLAPEVLRALEMWAP